MLGDAVPYLILVAAGTVAGAINVIAGGGSFLTLPVLIFLGLPPTVANGTNRIAILVQNVGAVASFQRHGLIGGSLLARAAVPAVIGAVVGTWIAIEIGDETFRDLLALLMIVVSLWTLWDPAGAASGQGGGATRLGEVTFPLAFFAIGIYGGFVQAGVGFLVLAATTLAGLDLVRGNALKVSLILVFTPIALGIFAWAGKVDPGMGAALALGNLTGGLIGVRLTVLRGHAWVKRVVTVAVIAFAILLWVAP
ncbi:MAG: sulfite exporter TauE/SafE family protein [Gemmatimonadota bacterium]|nr:sulfite exporter TauE/SafE family protein [Gemmatimonadota bacterium]